MEPTGWWQRVVRFFRWKPSTHRQVWLYAVFGIGVPAFVIWSVIGVDPKPYAAIIYAASITLFGGLARSKKLNRRRREGR